MSDSLGQLIEASATELFSELSAAFLSRAKESPTMETWDDAEWQALVSHGMPAALLDEESGGVGFEQGWALLRVAGRYPFRSPLPEVMMCFWLLSKAGMAPGPAAAVFSDDTLQLVHVNGTSLITGTLSGVPWGRHCNLVAQVEGDGGPYLALVARDYVQYQFDHNIAGEPRDRCIVNCELPEARMAPFPPALKPGGLRALGAAMRTAQLAGAMHAAVEMTVEYVRGRQQFGKSLSAFQAIQQMLAVMTGHAAASGVASDLACEGVCSQTHAAIAIAKTRASEAAGIVASMAHQMHGAMGFTRDYPLHLLTRRLWSWRDEYGTEAEWSIGLGSTLSGLSGDALWSTLSHV